MCACIHTCDTYRSSVEASEVARTVSFAGPCFFGTQMIRTSTLSTSCELAMFLSPETRTGKDTRCSGRFFFFQKTFCFGHFGNCGWETR